MRIVRAVAVFAFTLGPASGAAQAAADSTLPAPFLRRIARKGPGRFYTATDIAKMHAAAAPQLLARISGGSLREVDKGTTALVSRRGGPQTVDARADNEFCRIGVVLNDRLVPDDFDLKSITVDEIVGIEFYNGPSTIPPELNATGRDAGRCGLLVVWQKGG